MRFFAILLVVLGAGFGWAMWQGIDLATGWLVEAEVPAPDWLVLDELNEVESTAAEQGPASPGPTLEIEETIVATSELAPEPAGTTLPLAPAQDAIAEAPTETDTTLAVSSETPARDTAQPKLNGDVGVAEPLISAPTVQEPATEAASAGAAAPDPTPPLAATATAAEAAASELTRPEPDLSVAAEPLISAPTVQEPAPEAASADPEPSAAPEPAVELPATEPPATEAPADEPAQPVQAEAPQCNIEACTAAYRSFRASDCTYQPFEGPRQLCTQGPQAPEPLEAEAATAATQPVQTEALQCNIERCTAAFRSFRASDCTYQPFEGSRQLCPY